MSPRVRVTAGDVPLRVPDDERPAGVLVEPGNTVTVQLDERDIARLKEAGVKVSPAGKSSNAR